MKKSEILRTLETTSPPPTRGLFNWPFLRWWSRYWSLLFVALWLILRGLFVLKLVLVAFCTFCSICACFGFVCFPLPLSIWKRAAVGDCGTPWTFLLLLFRNNKWNRKLYIKWFVFSSLKIGLKYPSFGRIWGPFSFSHLVCIRDIYDQNY